MNNKPYEKSLAIAHLALVLTGVALLAIMTFGLVKLELRTSSLADRVDGLLTDVQKRIDGTFQNTNAVLIQAGLAADEVRLTSITEHKYLASISRETLKTVKAVNGSVADFDGVLKASRLTVTAINTNTIPLVNAAIASATEAIDTSKVVIREAGPTIDALTVTAHESTVVMTDLHKLLDAPAMREIGTNLAGATKHLDGTSAEVEETVGYIRDDFKPSKKNFWHNLTSQIIPTFLRLLIPTPVRIVHSPI